MNRANLPLAPPTPWKRSLSLIGFRPLKLTACGLRKLAVLTLDGTLAAGSFWLAMMLRFEGSVIEPYRSTLFAFMGLLACYRIASNLLFGLHRWSFRFSNLADGARIGMAGLFGTGLLLITMFLLGDIVPPRSVVVLELLLSTLLMAAVRFSPRLAGIYAKDWAHNRREGSLRTLIVGAGAAGEMLLRDLQRTHDHHYNVIGFVDDDPSKWEMIVGGRTVLGSLDDLRTLAQQYRVEQVLLAIPLLQGRRVREILSLCGDLSLRFKILPVSYVYLNLRAASSMLQDLTPEDLLPRDPVTLLSSDETALIQGRRALVTGAAGSIGSEICIQLLRAGLESLVMVDLNENGLYMLERRIERDFPTVRIDIEVADIRDAARIRSLFQRHLPQDVFHAAAHKHVPLMEAAPCEAVKNNVLGTKNVAEAADAYGADRFVYISTDKAVRPTSVMGACKRVGEEIVRAMARNSSTQFCAVRFGNVLGSAGSVVPIFREQIAAGGPVSVTHPEVRRYFMTISEAVSLVVKAGYENYGELCVLDMGEQIRIDDLARHMITMVGLVPEVDIPIVYSGLRPGEKLYEELLTEEEEQASRVNHRIFVAQCPPPPEELWNRLQELVEACRFENDARAVDLLYRLVPSYTPFCEIPASPPQQPVADAATGHA